MSLDIAATKPHERLAEALAEDLARVNAMIRARMASEHAPRIPEVTAHLIEAGGKRLRPQDVITHFEGVVLGELDLRLESASASELRKNLLPMQQDGSWSKLLLRMLLDKPQPRRT